jgi:hypothetical protein
MGGYGSGVRFTYSKKTTVEDCRVLSAAELMSLGMLRSNVRWPGSVAWTNTTTGEKVSNIGFDADTGYDFGSARLHYNHAPALGRLAVVVHMSIDWYWAGLWSACRQAVPAPRQELLWLSALPRPDLHQLPRVAQVRRLPCGSGRADGAVAKRSGQVAEARFRLECECREGG